MSLYLIKFGMKTVEMRWKRLENLSDIQHKTDTAASMKSNLYGMVWWELKIIVSEWLTSSLKMDAEIWLYELLRLNERMPGNALVPTKADSEAVVEDVFWEKQFKPQIIDVLSENTDVQDFLEHRFWQSVHK